MLGKITSYFLLALTILLCTVTLMFSTPWGSHITVVLINKVTPVDVVYKKGILLKDIELSYFLYKQKELKIQANNIQLELHPQCIWQLTLCVDALAMQSLSINIEETVEIENPQSKNNTTIKKIDFPFTIKANQLSVEDLSVVLEGVNGVTITGLNVQTNTVIKDSKITLLNPNVNALIVKLNESNSDTKNSSNTVNVNNDGKTWPLASLPSIALPIDLAIEQANIKQFTLQGSDNIEQSLNDNKFTLSWQDTQLNIKHIETKYSNYGKIALKGTVNFSHPYQINTEIESELTNIQPKFLLENTKQNIKLSGDLSALVFNATLLGNVEIEAKGKINVTDQNLPFNSTISIIDLPELNRIVAASEPVTVTIKANGDINAQQLSLNSHLNTYGYENAHITLTAHHINNTVTIDAFEFNDAMSKSELNLIGKLQYGDDILWDLSLASSGLTLPKIEDLTTPIQGRLSGNINFSGVNNSHHLKVKFTDSIVKGMVNKIPVAAATNIELAYQHLSKQWDLKQSELQITAGKSTFKIDGYTDKNWHVNGLLSIPSLKEFIAESRGDLFTKFSLNGDINQPNIQFDNVFTDLYWQKTSSSSLSISGNYQPLQSHKINANLISDKVYWQNLVLNNLNANVEGDLNQHNINISWLGDLATNISLSGQWLASKSQWKSVLTNSEISYKGKQWRPDKDIKIQYDVNQKSLWVEQHCWDGKSIRLCANDDLIIAEVGEISLIADINLKDVDDLFIPDDIHITTQLYNEIAIKWSPLTPLLLSVDSKLSEGSIELLKTIDTTEKPVKIYWEKGEATFSLLNEQLTSNILITPKLALNNSVKALKEKPTLIDIAAMIDFKKDKKLAGKINVDDLNLFFLQAYISEVSHLNGIFSSNINLGGTLTSPEFYGKTTITNTDINLVRTANKMTDLNINIELLGKSAKLTGQALINKDAINLKGDIDWQTKLNAMVNINAEHLNLIHPPDISATISSNITIELHEDNISLTGIINVEKGNVIISKLPEGSVTLSNDVVIVNDQGDEINQQTRFAISTDLIVNIDDKFKIAGYGFNGVLGGKLIVRQDPHQDLQLFGNLNLVDGLYRAYGQRLAVNKGRISFNGPVDNPLVDIRAVRFLSQENITAGIEISGPANALSINLFSTPTKTKAEILSYMVRGRGLDSNTQGSSGLGVALGATLANSSGILEKIEKLPLLNNLEISGDENQASLAGYVGNNLYLKYGVGIAEPINELTVRFYLLSRLWLEVVSGLEQSADVYFSFDVK